MAQNSGSGMTGKLSWKTCMWPEDKHPRPLCRHVWERTFRDDNEGALPFTQGKMEEQWEKVVALMGPEVCPCANEMNAIANGGASEEK